MVTFYLNKCQSEKIMNCPKPPTVECYYVASKVSLISYKSASHTMEWTEVTFVDRTSSLTERPQLTREHRLKKV